MPDMLIKLYDMPNVTQASRDDLETKLEKEGIKIKRAMVLEKSVVAEFAKVQFNYLWENEVERAIFNRPSSCYIAVKDKKIIGFACYDATGLGFFGPMGVAPEEEGKGVGKALLFKCLESMKEKGYGYAIIGYVTDAVPFYEKAVNARVIEDSDLGKSIYCNLISVE